MPCLKQSRRTHRPTALAMEDRSRHDPVTATYPVSAGPQRNSCLNLTGQPYLAWRVGRPWRFEQSTVHEERIEYDLVA